MYLLSKPAKLTFNGNNIRRDINFLCDDRLFNIDSTYDIDVRGSYTPQEALSIIKQYLGFNPFRDLGKIYLTNSANYKMSDLTFNALELLGELNADLQYLETTGGNEQFTNFTTNDNLPFTLPLAWQIPDDAPGYITSNTTFTLTNLYHFAGSFYTGNVCNMYVNVLSENIYVNGNYNVTNETHYHRIEIRLTPSFTDNILTFTRIRIHAPDGTGTISPTFLAMFNVFGNSAHDEEVTTLDNPYENIGGDSGTGGGDGSGELDGVDPSLLPDIPSISAITSGLMSVYAPSVQQLQLLGSFLWSSGFDLNDLKKLFANPMDALIGLSIVPVTPTTAGLKNVKFGNVDTGVSMNYVSSQFIRVSLGTVHIDKYVGCFLDYEPYVKIQIYLPYIGFKTLSADDVVGENISVTYHIDVVTGGCAAFIQCGSKGILYQFNGSCIANVPLTANNFSGAIQNAVSSVISGAGVIAGAVSGAAPLTAVSTASLVQSASNTALNSKPQIERSGSMGGSSGLLSIQKPYIIITRPNMSVPRNLNKYVGNVLNVTMKLNQCSGFTMVQFINLSGIACTDDERKELLKLLNEGVIL